MRRDLYIVAECKRANPAYSDWVFSRASYIHPVQLAHATFVEQVSRTDYGVSGSQLIHLEHSEKIHHIGLEIKTSKKGDRYGSISDQIEHASTQACLGLNGLIDS